MQTTGQVIHGAIQLDSPLALPDGTRVVISVERDLPAPKHQRQGNWWQGQVWIADDFDDLPDDIAKAFGMIDE